MELVIIVGGILFTFGYILFSSPGDKLRKKYSLFNTSLKSNSKEDEEVYECLEENGIEPCFLQNDLKHIEENKKENKCESFTSCVKKAPLTNHHQLQMIILNSYNNRSKENDDGYSMKLRRK